jgi:hypothetical protein
MGKVPLMRLLIPFVRTPTNIVKFQFQRSLPGVFSPRNIQGVMAGGVERDDAIARLGVGTVMSLAGLSTAFKLGDNITGAAPTSPGEKNAFYDSGKKPYSVKIGDRWIAYNRFQPIGMYLTQAVGLRDALNRGDSKTAGNILSSLAVTTAKGLADLPFVSGVNNVITALNDPSQTSAANKAIGGVLAGLFPNIGRDIATASDQYQRQAKSVTDQVKLMIPGQRQTLKPYTNAFGQPEKSTVGAFERGFVKITSKEQPSKLYDALHEANYYPSPIQKTQRGVKLNSQQLQQVEEKTGQTFATKLAKAINDSYYQNQPQDVKQKILSTMEADAKTQALNDVLGQALKKQSVRIKHY